MDPLFLLSGIGMMLTAITSWAYWARTRRVSAWLFLYGGIVWIMAIAVKMAMDFTVSPSIVGGIYLVYPSIALFLVGLYVGMRTGFLECGFSFIMASRTALRRVDFREAVAFGIGFGGVESLVLGLNSFISLLVLVFFPDLLPPGQLAAVKEQLSGGHLLIPAPIIERFFTLLLHVFTSVLVIYAVRTEKIQPLLLSVLLKAAADGVLPWLIENVGTETLLEVYTIEAVVVAFGLMSLAGLVLMKGRFWKPPLVSP